MRSRTVRLLVVDDDALFHQEVATFLTNCGHDVAIAPTARKALEELDRLGTGSNADAARFEAGCGPKPKGRSSGGP